MKFALLGDDPVVLPLIRAITRHADHAMTHAALAGDLEAEILSLIPTLKIVGGWEDLLAGDWSAVIVCGSSDLIGDSTKQLAAAGQTLAVFPQGGWETELVYELSLLRDDNGVRLIPICPLVDHPRFGDFSSWNDTPPAPSQTLLNLRCELETSIESSIESPADSLRDCLLPDVGLFRKLGGEYHQVTAVQSKTPSGKLMMATVTLTGDHLPDAVWTLRPVRSRSKWELTLTRQSGTDTFQRIGDAGDIVRHNEAELAEANPSVDAGAQILITIENALSQANHRPDWTDLTRDFEVLDAVRRSLRKRRTIDLHFETTSERSLFKTQMTAMGCGVLLLTLFAVVLLLLLGTVLDGRSTQEIAAQNADTIFYAAEFEEGAGDLTPDGQMHWERVEAERQDPDMVPILVEQTNDIELSQTRSNNLKQLLFTENIPNAEHRVELQVLAGPWFAKVMRIARIAVFLPLFLFLGLQGLLLITRPAKSDRKIENFS